MNQYPTIVINALSEWFLPLMVLAATVIVGYILRQVLFARIIRWAEKTETKIDDIILAATKGPFIIWFLMLGLYLGLEVSKLPLNVINIIDKILIVLGILSVSIAVSNIIARSITEYSAKVDSAFPVTSLTQNISRVIIFGIAILIILHTFGITITPILATLGVGGLAVALALQDTLSNLFSGFHISVARQIKIGDYIKLESGQEGYVTDINWRTTEIRMLSNNIVLVPNAKLIQTIVTNYYIPGKDMAVLVEVGVHYKSDLKKVEKVTIEVAGEVMKEVTGGVPDFNPFIRYHTFGDSSINFTVIMRAKEFTDQYLIKHEFVKKLHVRYAKEDIVIPYPIRAINYDQEKAK
jgi:small-conductance mechanosensitive channel